MAETILEDPPSSERLMILGSCKKSGRTEARRDGSAVTIFGRREGTICGRPCMKIHPSSRQAVRSEFLRNSADAEQTSCSASPPLASPKSSIPK